MYVQPKHPKCFETSPQSMSTNESCVALQVSQYQHLSRALWSLASHACCWPPWPPSGAAGRGAPGEVRHVVPDLLMPGPGGGPVQPGPVGPHGARRWGQGRWIGNVPWTHWPNVRDPNTKPTVVIEKCHTSPLGSSCMTSWEGHKREVHCPPLCRGYPDHTIAFQPWDFHFQKTRQPTGVF